MNGVSGDTAELSSAQSRRSMTGIRFVLDGKRAARHRCSRGLTCVPAGAAAGDARH